MRGRAVRGATQPLRIAPEGARDGHRCRPLPPAPFYKGGKLSGAMHDVDEATTSNTITAMALGVPPAVWHHPALWSGQEGQP